MSRQIGKVNLIETALLIAALGLTSLPADQTGIDRLINLRALYNTAVSLETKVSPINLDGRYNSLYAFAYEVKSYYCEQHYNKLQEKLGNYRAKAINFIAGLKNQGGFLYFFKGKPIEAMKRISEDEPYLKRATERLELQGALINVTEIDIECVLAKHSIQTLDLMLFVLQTDIKYLIVEDRAAINRGIHLYKKHNGNNNKKIKEFDHIIELDPKKKELVFNYYVARDETNEKKIGESITHWNNLGNLVIGRLLDSCIALLKYRDLWSKLELNRQNKCAQSNFEPKDESFDSDHKLSKYDETAFLCKDLRDV